MRFGMFDFFEFLYVVGGIYRNVFEYNCVGCIGVGFFGFFNKLLC